jgi:hypothetical protein
VRVILPPGVECPPCLASIPVHRSDDWTLLGSPVGSEAAIDACCRAVADRIVARVAALSALAHPQVVYAFLRHCGPWALGVYYARAAGAPDVGLGAARRGLAVPAAGFLLRFRPRRPVTV